MKMSNRLLLLAVYVGMFAALATVSVAKSGKTVGARGSVATPATAKPSHEFFIIGVWYQPASSFEKWKDRRVNTLWGYEGEGGTVSVDAWCAGAVKAQLRYVLQNKPQTRSHWNDLNCVAVAIDPDEANAQGAPGGQPTPPASLVAQRGEIREWTLKPIVINFDGWKLQWQTDAEVKAYCDVAEWLALDYYLVNRGEGISVWSRLQTQIDRLKRLAPGKPVIVFIETSDQNLKVQGWLHTPENQPQGELQAALMRGPTAQETTYELDQSAASGCWVTYFPDRIGVNWEAYDTTPDDVAAAITAWNVARGISGNAPPVPTPGKTVVRVVTVTIYGDGSSEVTSK